jgi:RNA-directed DNA polymerase
VELENFLVTQNTHFMALNIFNMPYESISKIIYPKPKYKQFVLAKKSGGYRIIDAPNFHLKDLQRKFLEFLLKKIDKPKACVHGFVQGRSIVSNAEAHCSKKTSFVLNVDLKDFFLLLVSTVFAAFLKIAHLISVEV